MSDENHVCIFGNSLVVSDLHDYFVNNSLGDGLYLRYEPTRKKVNDTRKRNSYLDVHCNNYEYKKIRNYLKLKNINVKVALKYRQETIIK